MLEKELSKATIIEKNGFNEASSGEKKRATKQRELVHRQREETPVLNEQ